LININFYTPEEHQKRLDTFIAYCKDNNITEDLNETLNTAGLLQGNLQQ
jgi:hypothetical protein